MKKSFILSLAIAAMSLVATPAHAQLNNLLNSVLQGVSQSTGTSDETTSLISNIIGAVAGNQLTTAQSVVGSWSYSKPCVQFESENQFSKAGGTIIAGTVENKLAKIYQRCGIKAGSFSFTFNEDGTCVYGIGSKTRQISYTFNNEDKTITFTTLTGHQVKAYVSVAGSSLALTFEASKLLVLFQTLSSKMTTLATVAALTKNYNGMKVGFEFASSK